MVSQEQAGGMPCPVCKVPLTMADRQGIEIDYCPQCRGVWLDRGELDKIIERSVAAEAPPARQAAQQPPQTYQQGYQQPHYSRHDHKRKKHWLSDIFD